MDTPTNLRFSESHEWARLEGDIAVVGVTDHAQQQLGDVVFVDLPEVGAEVQAGEGCGEIESVKAVSDVNSPVSGEVVEVNEVIEDAPESVNKDPYAAGWLFKVKVSDLAQLDALMDAAAYDAHAAADSH